MSSQPDTEALYRLNPEVAPPDQSVVVAQLREERQNLAEMYAKAASLTQPEVELALTQYAEEKAAIAHGDAPAVPDAPQSEQPATEPDKTEAPTEPEAVTADEAAFYASSEGSSYYPIATHGDTKIKPENRVYFLTEDDAKAAGYKAAA